MRPEVREALDLLAEQGVIISGPEDELDALIVEDGKVSIISDTPPKLTLTEDGGATGPVRWWHVYGGGCIHWGGNVTTIAGNSSRDPEWLVAEGKLTMPAGLKGCSCELVYLRSFDHEPTAAEMDRLYEIVAVRNAELWAEEDE